MIERQKIALITGNWTKDNRSIAGTFFKLMKIFLPISSNIIIISPNHSIKIDDPKVHSKIIYYKYTKKSLFKSAFYFLVYQINILLVMVNNIRSKEVDVFIFCFGADLFVLPIILAKIFRKKVIIRTDGRPSIITKHFKRARSIELLKIVFFETMEKINYSLADMIVPESEYMIYFHKFQEYKRKLIIGPLYVDDIFLKNNKKLNNREYSIGYIGQFSEVKGVLNFVQSLVILRKKGFTLKALFVGDGNLKDEVEKVVYDYNLQAKFAGWIEKDKMPIHYVSIRLLILPSLVEGLPNSVLEAMACETLVLATPVGGVPSVIKDGETGFIMESNSPECIMENVLRALNHPDKERIVENARALVMRDFTYKRAVERYGKILKKL